MVSMPLSNQRGSPIPQSKLASTKPELAQQQPIQAQPVSIAPNRPSVAAINPLPGGSKMRSSWLTKAVADQGGQISMQPKKSLGAALAAQAKKSMGAHSGSAPSSAVLKRKSEQDDDLAKEREDYRKSKVLKSSYGGGLLSRSEEESRASKPASQPTKVETTAPTDIIVPISKESEDDEDEDEDEEDDDEGGEDFTSFDKLRENVGKFKEQRAKSIHHIDITERFNVNIKHLEDDVPQETSVTGDHMPNAKNSFSSVAQTTPVSTSNDARPPSLANVSSHSQTRLSLSELVSAKDLVPKKQDTADKGSAKSAAPKEPPSFHLLKESIASTTPPNSPPKSHTLSKQNSFATAAKPPLFSKAATEVPQPTTSTNSEGSNKSSTWDDMMSLMNPPPSTSAASVPPPPQSIFFQQVEAPRSPSPAPVKPLANNPFLTKAESNSPSKANAFKVPADLFSAAAPLAPQSTFSSDTFSQTSSVPDSIFSVTQVDSQAFLYPEMGSFNEVFAQPVKETHVAQSNTGPTKPKEPVVAHVNPVPVSKETKVEKTEEMDDADIEDDDGDVDMAEETQLTQPEVPATPSSGMLSASSIFGTAAHLVAKAFGSSKAKKEPLKSLHAAAAAKAEQEEKEREKARRKEQMEQRRLVANQKNQKKMGDERAKQAEAEKKKKEEVERKKREREEMNVSKVGKGKKVEEEEPVKKRKITVEVGKKPELKKQPSKDKLNASFQAGAVAAASSIARANTSRPASQQSNYTSQASAKPAIKKATGVASSSQTVGATSGAGPSFSKLPQNISQTVAPPTAASSASVKLVPVGPPNVNGWTASNTASGSSKPVPATTPKQVQRSSKASLNGKQPSQAIHAQMQARVAAQMGKDKEKEEAVAASEQIELPDINSEYSDSEDEDRGKDLPDWAQSPELADALRSQRTFNPEDLFGPIGPLKMEEIFKTRHSRFRSRTSSANWNGADRLTEMEELEYARRMGFR
ncbi:hypothetical protein FRC02_004841 [Tulasnella sp. 418]|nr:hypothetical protein FRC02_004841 [Tulasnella sp. 418]